MVVREAVGDRSPAAHDQSLFDLGQKYADIVGVDEVAALIRGFLADRLYLVLMRRALIWRE